MHRLKNQFSFTGTAKRSQFLRQLAGSAFLVWIAGIIDERLLAPWRGFLPGEVGAGSPLAVGVIVILAVPMLAVMAKRLHAHGKPGWWLLIAFTGIGVLLLLYWFLVKEPKFRADVGA